MWQPGFERYYNENLSPKITYALGAVIINHNALAATKPGIYPINFADTFTPSLLIRSRLQTQSIKNPSDNPAVVVVSGAAPAGGKKKK